MLTVFTSNDSRKINAYTSSASILVGRNASTYYCAYFDHDALNNANVHITTVSNGISSVGCRNLDVYRIKGSGGLSYSVDYEKTRRYPYMGSVLLCILKYSEGQKTTFYDQIIDIKTLPFYTNSGDVIYRNHFFNSSSISGVYTVDIRFDVRKKITIKPNQRLRCCAVLFWGYQPVVRNISYDLTTTVFYKGN